jgi:hypothetical protein
VEAVGFEDGFAAVVEELATKKDITAKQGIQRRKTRSYKEQITMLVYLDLARWSWDI